MGSPRDILVPSGQLFYAEEQQGGWLAKSSPSRHLKRGEPGHQTCRHKLVATALFSSRRIGVTSACPEAQVATWFGSFGDDPEAVALVERHILWPYCPEIGRDSVSVCTIQN